MRGIRFASSKISLNLKCFRTYVHSLWEAQRRDLLQCKKIEIIQSSQQRPHYVHYALQRDPGVSIGLSNRGRFVDKLAPLRKLYPVPVGFLFIVGFDTLLRVMDERYYRDQPRAIARLFQECQFRIAHRGDQREDSFEDFFRRKENREYRNRVSFFVLPEEVSFLSSSLVRRTIRQGKSATGLVPPKILRFIQETGLYQTRDQRSKGSNPL